MIGHAVINAHTIELVAIGIAVLLAFGVFKLFKSVLKEAEKVAVAAIVWRLVSGAHLHGKKHTDAGWFTHGTRSKRHEFDQTGWMNRWEHKPRAHRALYRWVCFFAFIGVIYGLFAAWTVTTHALAALIVYGLAMAGFAVESKIRLRAHNKHVLTPIVKSLAVSMRMTPHAVRRLVHISPENIKDEGEVGWIELPPEFTPSVDMQATMERIVDSHLLVDTELIFQTQQAPKIAVIRAGLKPPIEVLWDETLEAMEMAAYGDIVIGKDRYKNVFTANFLKLDDPHWAFSVNTKRGKSNFLGLVSVQVLHQDPLAQVIVIDPKEESLIDYLGAPFEGVGVKPLIPGVTMACDPTRPEQMWAALAKARKILDTRRREYARDRTKKFPTCLIILDELNMFERITNKVWAEYVAEDKRRPKEEQEGLPKECPAWDDVYALLTTGRFVGVHVIAVAQDFQAHIIGGKGARNLFGLRGMAGYQPNQWKYFIGGTPVESQNGIGRWIITQGERRDWVQITRCDGDKAYAWGCHGRTEFVEEVIVDEAALPLVDRGEETVATLFSASTGEEHTTTTAVPVTPRRVIVGLRAAADYLGMTKRNLEAYRDRHGEIPGMFKQGRNVAWYADDLDAWKRDREGGSVSDD